MDFNDWKKHLSFNFDYQLMLVEMIHDDCPKTYSVCVDSCKVSSDEFDSELYWFYSFCCQSGYNRKFEEPIVKDCSCCETRKLLNEYIKESGFEL